MEELINNHLDVGHWELFYPDLDLAWDLANIAYASGTIPGVTQMQCETGKKTGLIRFFCSNSDDKKHILNTGRFIIDQTGYDATKRVEYKGRANYVIVIAPNSLVIDCETTGFARGKDPKVLEHFDNARLLELGYVLLNTNTSGIISTYSQLVKPDNFQVRATEIHGITTTMANQDGVSIHQIFDHLESIIDNFGVVVAHNITFDTSILLSEMHRYGREELYRKFASKMFMCSMAIGTKMMGQKKQVSLRNLVQHLGVAEEQQHRALPDAMMCCNCMTKMRELRDNGDTSVVMAPIKLQY